ncbi:hypothetical protein SSX86_021178 [Deinandra increscens subsp. villosa]|uniref:Glutaredoxin domain-containing protein n=1 Tax=Deinandra increscens subsp. villosa TaxID=3103831 RepID=A0AAP0CWC8_9ASTR
MARALSSMLLKGFRSMEYSRTTASDIKDNHVMLYMKGDPEQPRCGFSSLAVRVLSEYRVPIHSRNILEDPELKNAVKAFSMWPTFPQVFINGEFIGGSDIILNMHQNGELKEKLKTSSSDVGQFLCENVCIAKKEPPLKSGQVLILQVDYVVIRSAKPYLATSGATVHGHYGEILYEGDTLVTFIYEKSRSGDITQGLPKVEHVLEVRSIDSISRNLEKSIEGWNKCITRILGIHWAFFIVAELSIVQSRIFFVNKVQKIDPGREVKCSGKVSHDTKQRSFDVNEVVEDVSEGGFEDGGGDKEIEDLVGREGISVFEERREVVVRGGEGDLEKADSGGG